MLQEYVITFGWGITGAVTMAVSLLIVLTLFSLLTPKLKEFEELKNGNIAVGILLGALFIATGIVIAAAIVPSMTEVMPIITGGK